MALKDKLEYLNETKQAIKQAIIDKGQAVADTDTFRSYAEKIEAIEAGGSGGAYDIEQVLDEATGAFELRITDAVGDEKEFTVMLPSAFATATNIYYFQVNKDVILFSADVTNIGVWGYEIKTKTLTQLYAAGNTFSGFKIFENDCFIYSASVKATGLLLYNANTKTITQIYTGYNWRHFKTINNNLYISSLGNTYGGGDSTNAGLLLYDKETKTVEQIYSKGHSWGNWVPVGDNYIIASTGSSGVLFYEPTTIEFTQVISSGKWNAFEVINNGILITSNTTTVNSTGVYFFDLATKISTKVSNENLYFGAMQPVGNDCLIGGRIETSTTADDTNGVWLYEASTNSVTQLFEGSYKYSIFQKVGDNYLITSAFNGASILLYDVTTKTITQLYEGGLWKYFVPINDDCLIGGSSSSSKGILLYEASTKTITPIYESNDYGWGAYYYKFGDNFMISASAASGILLYETATKTFTKIYSSGNWGYYQSVGNGDILIGGITNGSASAGVLLYDATLKTITKIITTGYYYNTFEFDANGNVYVSASNKEDNKYTFYYNATTKTASLTGYYVEVE